MDEKTRDAMLKIIEDKNRKSSEQSGIQRRPGRLGDTRGVIKKLKKGGLFDK